MGGERLNDIPDWLGTGLEPVLVQVTLVDLNAAQRETDFKLRRMTALSKVFKAYADRIGEDRATLQFFDEDGRLLKDEDTMASLYPDEDKNMHHYFEVVRIKSSPPEVLERPGR